MTLYFHVAPLNLWSQACGGRERLDHGAVTGYRRASRQKVFHLHRDDNKAESIVSVFERLLSCTVVRPELEMR